MFQIWRFKPRNAIWTSRFSPLAFRRKSSFYHLFHVLASSSTQLSLCVEFLSNYLTEFDLKLNELDGISVSSISLLMSCRQLNPSTVLYIHIFTFSYSHLIVSFITTQLMWSFTLRSVLNFYWVLPLSKWPLIVIVTTQMISHCVTVTLYDHVIVATVQSCEPISWDLNSTINQVAKV